MAHDLSIEYPDQAVFITIRTIASRLWFVNNKALHQEILGYLAKYQEKFEVILYGFVLMGNHYHILAQFPKSNRAAFLQSFNAIIAKLVAKHVPSFTDGKLWARRPKVQPVPNNEDILHMFKYLTLNPISSGLCQRLAEFNSYNSLHDTLSGVPKVYSLIDNTDYSNRRRYNRRLKRQDCKKEYTLTYSRLPGFSKLSLEEYRKTISDKLEERRKEIISERLANKQGFAGKSNLRSIKPGTKPRKTKTSTRNSKRPLVLTLCEKTRKEFIEQYFAILESYRQASARFRSGNFYVKFPPGTYRPIVQVSP